MKAGMHHIDLEAGPEFFEAFEGSQIKNGLVRVFLDLEKQERMLVLAFRFQGQVETPCDRCNEPLECPVEGNARLIVKFGAAYEEQSDEIQIIPETSTRLDVSPFVYEYIQLLLPARRVHPDNERGESTCSRAVLKKLEELSSTDREDPRWDVLKKLKDRLPGH
jgi:uncharacterized protein